jgi:crossover junction endodeoxyribonuclease RusA
MVISKKGREFRADVVRMLCKYRGLYSAEQRLTINVWLSAPDRRRTDCDNRIKALFDALQHAEVYPDDSQIDEIHVYRGPVDSEKKGFVFVSIEVLPSERK